TADAGWSAGCPSLPEEGHSLPTPSPIPTPVPSPDREPPASTPATARMAAAGFSPRAAALLVLLAILCAFWVVGSEVVTSTCLVGESVPAIPALGCLLFLAASSRLLRRR